MSCHLVSAPQGCVVCQSLSQTTSTPPTLFTRPFHNINHGTYEFVGARPSRQNTDTVTFNMDISIRSCQGGADIDHLQFLVQSQMSFASQDFVRAPVAARGSFTTSQNVSSFHQFLGQGAIIKNNNQNAGCLRS